MGKTPEQGYKPTEGETGRAEEMMTKKQEKQSEKREKEFIDKSANVLLGDAYASKGGERDQALKAYKEAGDKEKLIGLAFDSLKAYNLKLARKAYEAAGEELTNEKLIEIGNTFINEGWLGSARYVYKSAGRELPKEKLIELGDALFKAAVDSDNLDLYEDAFEAYEAVGKELPKEKLIELGKHCIGRGFGGLGRKCFKVAARLESSGKE